MKAIIPVAGAGTKLRPNSYTQPKALIPLAGKTVLSIIIDQLRNAGIKEFIFTQGACNPQFSLEQALVNPHIPAFHIGISLKTVEGLKIGPGMFIKCLEPRIRGGNKTIQPVCHPLAGPVGKIKPGLSL